LKFESSSHDWHVQPVVKDQSRDPPERRVLVELTLSIESKLGVSSKTFQTYRESLPLVNPKSHDFIIYFGATTPGTFLENQLCKTARGISLGDHNFLCRA
jgi:hypothetical protein